MCFLSQLSSKVTVTSCSFLQFLHTMFNISALLLDDALFKICCYRSRLFSVVSFKTLTFHKVVL